MSIRTAVVFFLFFISGALSLIYEVVWLRKLILVFGSTHFAVSTVLTSFMAGLAIGAYALGRLARRRWKPLVVYGIFEIGIGLYALAIPWIFSLLEPVSRWLWRSFSPDFYVFSLLRLVFVGAVLLVPTTLMGGTLPVLSHFVTRRRGRIGLSVGALYGINTFGAVAGTAATGFLLVPSLGVQRTIWLAAALNVLVGVISLVMGRRTSERLEDSPARERKRATVPAEVAAVKLPGQVKLLLLAFGVSGFIAMVYEVAWTRVLALIIGSSVYAFTIMLSTFLVGLAAGAIVMSWVADRIGPRWGTEGVAAILAATGITAFGTLSLFHQLPYLFWAAFHRFIASGPAGSWQSSLFGIEFLLAAVVMFPPTFFLGGIFPLVVRMCGQTLPHVGRSVGIAYASNTVGTILGSALGGFVAIPLLGIQGAIVVAVVLNLVLAASLLAVRPGGITGWRGVAAASCAILAVIFWYGQPSWKVLVMNSGVYQYALGIEALTPEGFVEDPLQRGEPLFYKEGVTATVMVARNESTGEISLSLDGKVDATTSGDLGTQLLIAHIPMLLADNPRDVLVIGYGSGITVGAVTTHPVESVTAVEVEAAVIEGSRAFSPYNHDPLSNPDVQIVAADGRNFLLTSEKTYDVIVSEPSNPWRTFASNLFTKEFYELARRRLKPGGVFCSWVQLYSLPPDLFKAVVRTFSSVFPNVNVYMSASAHDLIMIGSEEPVAPVLDRIGGRLTATRVGNDTARMKIDSAFDLLTYRMLGDAETRAFAGEGPLNTDDNALLEFQSPLFIYTATHMANTRALVAHLGDPLADARGVPTDPSSASGAYRELGRSYFERGMAIPALGALRRAQELHPTQEGAALMVAYQQWMEHQVRSRQGQQGV